MVTLRSRKLVPQTPHETLEKDLVAESVTPLKISERSARSSTSPPSGDAIVSGPGVASVCGAVRRRSLRLASKSNPRGASEGTWKTPASVGDGSRQCSSLETEGGPDLSRVRVRVSDACVNLPPLTRSAKRRLGIVDFDVPRAQNDGGEPVQEREGVSHDKRNKGVLMDVDGEQVENVLKENSHIKRKGFSKQEKGKFKLGEDPFPSNADPMELDVEPADIAVLDVSCIKDNLPAWDEQEAVEATKSGNFLVNKDYKEKFRKAAKKNAYRFAHFAPQEEVENMENSSTLEANGEEASRDANQDIEDWPGPFSTAMKIIKDRAMRVNESSSTEKSTPVPLIWYPRDKRQISKPLAPSLQELCIMILAKNTEAITSLQGVPDELRNRLTKLLCDSRRMTIHFLGLLFSGSPTEVSVSDCSWLTEELFTRTFEGCNTTNLMVLQLDQCGRCMPDYILRSTLARSSGGLPALTTISLKGACRLSDVGLNALVSAAPTIKSINLSQCSLLTSTCIDTLADHLGSALRELYIDDCQSIDAMCILPALNKLEYLEVLSLAGIQSVCDDFIMKLMNARGQDMRKLTLTNCAKLTDSSLKAISGNCSRLSSLDIVNLSKLTDSAIGYLANGCPAIETLKLCRNAFSDEAVAAFLETSGQSLIELSLNNVRKIGNNTAISLAKHSRKLLCLDLSWCRKLTDEALGLIVDSCSSLRVLKLFGCTQITNVFLDGHSNTHVKIIGMKMAPFLERPWEP